MNRLSVFVILIALAAVGWQNRVTLIVKILPRLLPFLKPVGPNVECPWSAGPDEADASPDERLPNIIIILTDDMGFNDISLYNGGAADGTLITRNIDALAHQGVAFHNGYAGNAVCSPSRATLMTGRYSTRFGFEYTPMPKVGFTIFQWMEQLEPRGLPMLFNQSSLADLPANPMTDLGMPTEEVTIAEILQQKGYYTAHIGKWHLGARFGMSPTDQGFHDSLNLKGTLYLPEQDPRVVNAKREKEGVERMIWAGGRYAVSFNDGLDMEPDGFLTDYFTREAVKVIEKNRHRPFFLYLAHWGLHNPLQASRVDYDSLSHIQDHHTRVYASMIKSVDRSVGAVTAALDSHGLTDNTLIVFTSDNGGAAYIGLPHLNQPFRGWKLNHFEGGTHVPFLAKWPLRITAGSQYTSPIHHIDILRTVAAAAEAEEYLPKDRKLDGVDLLPYIRGEVGVAIPHRTLFWRAGHHQSVQHDGWKLILAKQLKDKNKKWLFRLSEDPTEQRNLADSQPEQVALLEGLLHAHNAEQIESMWSSAVNAPMLVDKNYLSQYEPGDEYVYWPN